MSGFGPRFSMPQQRAAWGDKTSERPALVQGAHRLRCLSSKTRLGILVTLPVHAPGVGPEILQRVILARLWIEHVDHDVTVVLHDPPAGFVTLDAETAVAFRMEGGVDLLG